MCCAEGRGIIAFLKLNCFFKGGGGTSCFGKRLALEIFYSSVFIYYLRGNRGLEIYHLDKI